MVSGEWAVLTKISGLTVIFLAAGAVSIQHACMDSETFDDGVVGVVSSTGGRPAWKRVVLAMVYVGGPISVPLAWIVLRLIGSVMRHDCDNGWFAMGLLFGMGGLLSLIHLGCLACILLVWWRRRKRRERVGAGLICGFLYYLVLGGGSVVVLGPMEVLDSLLMSIWSLPHLVRVLVALVFRFGGGG